MIVMTWIKIIITFADFRLLSVPRPHYNNDNNNMIKITLQTFNYFLSLDHIIIMIMIIWWKSPCRLSILFVPRPHYDNDNYNDDMTNDNNHLADFQLLLVPRHAGDGASRKQWDRRTTDGLSQGEEMFTLTPFHWK